MAVADAEFVKKMSAKWVDLEGDALIHVVRRLCWETNKHLFKVAPDAPVRVFPVLSKVPGKDGVEKFGGLEHSPFFWFGKLTEGETWRDNSGFVTLNDQFPPMRAEAGKNPSMGPNVISNFSFDADFPKVNLFQGSTKHVQMMLAAFFDYRKTHERAIFKKIVDAMALPAAKDGVITGVDQTDGNFSYTDEIGNVTRIDHPDYVKTAEVLNCVNTRLETKDEATLADFGLKLVSFCQTWDVEKGSAGDYSLGLGEEMLPNFSVPSPHFQTRVVVADEEQLTRCLNGNGKTSDHVAAYARNADALTQLFKDRSYEGKFVNLDALWGKIKDFDDFKVEPCKDRRAAPLCETPAHAFFLHAAPCGGALDSLKYAHSAAKYCGAPFTVFIAADWKTFANHKTINTLPSNFRAPEKIWNEDEKDFAKKEKILTDEQWTQSQGEVTNSLSAILEYLRDQNIDVLYTSTPRSERPVNMTGAKLTDKTANTETTHAERVRFFLTTFEGQAYQAVFEANEINLVEQMNNVLKAYNGNGDAEMNLVDLVNKHAVARSSDLSEGKSFLADVLSVAFAVGHAIGCDGFFTKAVALTEGPCKEAEGLTVRKLQLAESPGGELKEHTRDVAAQYVEAKRGTVKGGTVEGKTIEAVSNGHYVACADTTGLMEMMKTLLVEPRMTVFGHATVWEDPGLNDADDYVATALIKKFSKTCHTDKFDWKQDVFIDKNIMDDNAKSAAKAESERQKAAKKKAAEDKLADAKGKESGGSKEAMARAKAAKWAATRS